MAIESSTASAAVSNASEVRAATELPLCFVISPIGAEGSDVRNTADKVLKHVITMALSGTR
jgi:hypothetical protein